MNQKSPQQKEIPQSQEQNQPHFIDEKIIEIQSYAYRYRQQFDNFFKMKPKSGFPILNFLDQIIKIEQLPQKDLSSFPFQPKNYEELFNLPPQDFISYIKTLNLSEQERRKVIKGWLANRCLKIHRLKMKGISFEDDKIWRLKKANQLRKILSEAESLGIENWDFFYRFGEEIQQAKTEEELSILEKNLANLPLEKEELRNRLAALIQRKRKSETKKWAIPTEKSDRKRKEEYQEALNQVLEYMRYIIPQKNESLRKIPEAIIKFLEKIRDPNWTPFIQAYNLCENFWPIRLQRPINFQRYGKIGEAIKRFLEKNLDRSLQTESAGFWIEKNFSSVFYLKDDREKLSLAIRSLILTLQPKGKIKITVILNDEKFYKLTIDPNQDLEKQIVSQLETPVFEEPSENNLYQLKQDTYTFGPISQKTPLFREIFGHERKFFNLIPFSIDPNDYCIRISTNPEEKPKNHPLSLFIVGNSQLTINFDFYPDRLNLGIKFAHRYFDGIPAKDFFRKYTRQLNLSPDQENKIYQEKPIDTDFPLFEGIAKRIIFSDEVLIEPFSEKDLKQFNPTFVYALAVALANDIDYFHFLVDGPNIFSQDSPYYSNVQPIVISFTPIKDVIEKIRKNQPLNSKDKEKLKIWRENVIAEYQRGKKGLGTPAVLSAPAGTLEKPLSEIGKRFHKGIRALINAQGMFSGIPDINPQEKIDPLVFFTAKSDAYQQEINLLKDSKSMGVIGFYQSQDENGNIVLVFTVRKNITQSQNEINQWIDISLPDPKDRQRTKKLITALLKSWEKLNQGKIDLNNYQKILEKIFEKLPPSLKSILKTKEGLQKKLNLLLQESAGNTVNFNLIENIRIVQQLLLNSL